MCGSKNDSENEVAVDCRVKDERFQHMSGTVQDELFMNELGTRHT